MYIKFIFSPHNWLSTLFSQETRNQSTVQCRPRHWTSGSTFRFRRSVRIGQSGFVSVQFSTQRFFPEIRCIKTKSVLEGCHLDWSVRPKTLKNGLSDGTGLSCSGSGRDFLAKIVQSGSWDDSQAHPANPDWTWMSDPGKTGRFFPDFFLALQWRRMERTTAQQDELETRGKSGKARSFANIRRKKK